MKATCSYSPDCKCVQDVSAHLIWMGQVSVAIWTGLYQHRHMNIGLFKSSKVSEHEMFPGLLCLVGTLTTKCRALVKLYFKRCVVFHIYLHALFAGWLFSDVPIMLIYYYYYFVRSFFFPLLYLTLFNMLIVINNKSENVLKVFD